MKALDPIEVRRLAELEKKVDAMVLLYSSGRSTGVIAEEVGFSRSTVRRYLKMRGITLGGRGAPRQVTDEYVNLANEYRKAGYAWEYISKKLGFSARQLQRWLYGK